MSNNYHIVRIQRYLAGELSRDEMYQLEREALEDPLLQDAIEGYSLQREVSHRQLSLLQQRLADRIAAQANERNTFYFGWQRLGVAATACVMMVVVLVLLWMRNQTHQQVAEKEVLVDLSAPGAVASIRSAAEGTSASPEGGWDAFNDYLLRHREEALPSGEVTLTFRIDEQGRPTGIETAENADKLLSLEAQRLLENGPRWNGEVVQLKLVFQ